ncbi:hypothetical protein ABFS82_03G039200 [Erythranthe guttata]|uniref:Sialate O-acetylesterase domain-containing protein n=1 Tax=Erythranthe guttata TaxID=4155 RepID=A0A022QG58_ERYGU|nr:PREDICTED: probable carbohydrate esterase At4g34215 [Erythranthe guttata]EYU25475.1 hypothetical protein MIMGU_mgv1a011640mg [Erythranthe guttata]|eukprot:XP_012851690.1 PREDICTED: probable carbohydrate esterase At4g34215 [Erythranthe guttata]
MSSLVWLLLLAHATLALSTDENLSDEFKSIFILAGQSNMAGRAGVISGKFTGEMPPACAPSPFILRLNPNLTWEEARDPLHEGIDINKTCGIGPGMPFANSVMERDSSIGVIGLVPCAAGGTNIEQWSRGGERLYNQLIQRAQAAMRGGGGVIRALLWYQGEADADDAGRAKNYKWKLEKFFTDVRSDLQLPQLPIIQVALASSKPGKYVDEIRKVQLGINLTNVICVDAWGFPLTGDKLHLNTDGEIQVGRLMADAFLKLKITPQPLPIGQTYA